MEEARRTCGGVMVAACWLRGTARRGGAGRGAAGGAWFFETEPSTGSSYANMSALAIFMPPTSVPMRPGCAATMSSIIFSAAGLSTPS